MISRPSEDWRYRARRALFGPEQVAPHVLLSPFATVVDTVGGAQTADGWWRRADTEDITALRVPQGSVCADAVLCLEEDTMVTFVGACGAHIDSEHIRVGTIVEATIATAFDGTIGRRSWQGPEAATPVEVATVRCLADSSIRHETLTGHCVDLETAWLLAAAAVAGCPARALLAITDTNSGGAVFTTTFTDVTTLLQDAVTLATRASRD